MMLFWKESKKTIGSLMFLLYAAALLVLYISQFVPETAALPTPPRQGEEESYGSIKKEVPEILMPAAIEGLLCEYQSESYTAYPYGFYKSVRLKEKERLEMAAILEELTGLTEAEADRFKEHGISETLSYERFKELMNRADELIGGGSNYSERYLLQNFCMIPMTYEEALAEYEETVDEKNVAESYTRLYCDYMGIGLGILPVFVCAGLWMLDKRSRMEQLIYVRKISSAKLILTRYLALFCCMMLPLIVTFAHAMYRVGRLCPEKEIFFVRAFGLAVLWLLPELMMVSASGALISELWSPFPAILLQGIWWYASVGANELTGDITKTTLLIRHNTLGAGALFQSQTADFLQNRAGYAVLALLSVVCLIVVYENKRKGGPRPKKRQTGGRIL